MQKVTIYAIFRWRQYNYLTRLFSSAYHVLCIYETKIFLPFIFILMVSINLVAFADTLDESEVLTRLFTDGPAHVGYTRQFASAVPQSTMEQVIAQITGQLGPFVEIEGDSNPYRVVFEEGVATTYISLAGQGDIAGLQIMEVIPSHQTLDDVVQQITNLEADTAILIRKNGVDLVAYQADIPLAVGSAFKLGVLAAVDDAVQEGTLQWAESVPLDPSWKSLSTGILQDWPSGTHVTIETLATLMISLSDNTATDALISLVGREKVEHYLPHSIPTLTTGELFRLKNPMNNDLLQQYRLSPPRDQRNILKKLRSRELPQPSLFAGDPVAIDVELFMSTTELASLIERLDNLDLMTINPGLAMREHWQRIAYKGGSEPGVLNLTTFLVDDDRNHYTVSITVNSSEGPLPEEEIMVIYQSILNSL